MPAETPDPLLGATVIVLAIASIGVWFALVDRLKHGPILPYEPRQPVPWNGAWTLLPIALVVLTIAAAFMSDGNSNEHEQASAHDIVERLALGSAMQTSLVVAFLAVVILSSNATRTDLGLPKSFAELARDIRIGVVAWLAAIVPVYATQIALLATFGPSEGHPLLKMVEHQSEPALFILAFVVAVLAAPICEELTFRVVLQGWLEKWDAKRFGKGQPSSSVAQTAASIPEVAALTDTEISAEETPLSAMVPGEREAVHCSWTPIVISSLLFALAHFGYGPDPVPLFALALILGYIYQRTHRVVPSIVAHALFNGMSLFALWRIMSAGGP